MLRGQVFSEQVFSNECFAHFINTFLNKKNGVTKGCNITNTNNSITVNAGYFCIQGRFLEVVGSDTLQITPNTEYCKLVCEIDLSQINTETQFNQASFKILSGTNNYPTLTQQDLENGGSIYQFEFAQFQNTTSGITNVKDTRTFLDFNGIYAEIQAEYRTILEELQEELADVEDGSIYVLKEEGKELSSNDFTNTYKTKLDGIANNANNYSHPTNSGNKHIPSGGSSGKILRWSADGTAAWGDDKDTTYGLATTSANGLMSSSDKSKLNGIASDATKNIINRGASAPSGGSNGDIYIQYF